MNAKLVAVLSGGFPSNNVGSPATPRPIYEEGLAQALQEHVNVLREALDRDPMPDPDADDLDRDMASLRQILARKSQGRRRRLIPVMLAVASLDDDPC